MEQCGMGWYGVERGSTDCFGVVLVGTVWYGMVRCGTGWFGVVQGGTEWYGVIRHGTEWYGMVRNSMEWYGVIWSDILRIGCPVYRISQWWRLTMNEYNIIRKTWMDFFLMWSRIFSSIVTSFNSVLNVWQNCSQEESYVASLFAGSPTYRCLNVECAKKPVIF